MGGETSRLAPGNRTRRQGFLVGDDEERKRIKSQSPCDVAARRHKAPSPTPVRPGKPPNKAAALAASIGAGLPAQASVERR